MKRLILFLVFAVGIGSSSHDFSNYPFKSTLNEDPLYELYWNFDNDAETISFAIRVETTGWVGLGLSPNGQMPDSDVVIGWVTDDGQTMFHDRFATTRGSPSVDTHQDWKLEHGEEENGYTILEFSRKYTTCDEYDLPITAETARVIWSFHSSADPSSEDIPHDLIHTNKGSASLNLLGGLQTSPEEPSDLTAFDIRVDNVVIPKNETTYWCSVSRMPEELRTNTGYITKFGPLVTEGNEAHVHHLIVYMCSGLDESHVGNEGDCDNGNLPVEVQMCRGSAFLAGWAVGGEDFEYPENVAFPFGGEGYIMIELHYDNPHEVEGTLDSSGMRVWYTNTPREHDAGILSVSHWITPLHVIPPNSENFISTGLMPEECTRDHIPERGIHVFANFFHTHLAGHGLTLQHIRYNSECSVYEELEPIDENLKYDFDYQQFTHLRREVLVKPGDILQLKCFYQTANNDRVTFGGLGTREEMCVTSVAYYPRIDFGFSSSQVSEAEFYEFLGTTRSGQQILNGEVEYVEGINNLGWDNDLRTRFQNKLDNSTQDVVCGTDFTNMVSRKSKFPEVGCSYVAPDQCSDFTPPSCCERIDGTVESGGTVLKTSVILLTSMSFLTSIIG